MARLIDFVDGFSSASAPTLGGYSGTTGAFSGNVTVGGTLGVTGATTLSSTLAVTGVSTLTGNVGVGAAPTYALDVQTTGTTAMLRVVGSTTNNVLFQSGASNSQTLELRGGTGDSSLLFSVNSSATPTFSVGVDNSDSGKFKISSGGSLGTTDRFVIDTSGNVGIGASPSGSALLPLLITKTQNNPSIARVLNSDAGSSAYAAFSVNSDSSSGNFKAFSAAGGDYVELSANSDASAGLRINSSHASSARVSLRIRSAEKAFIDDSGNAGLGVPSPATSATAGFPYIPVMAGTPSGTPTSITGMSPIVVDSSGSKLWVYFGGSWKSATLA